MEHYNSKVTQTEKYTNSKTYDSNLLRNNSNSNSNKIYILYNNFIVNNEKIVNYVCDNNGFVISKNKIIIRFNIKVDEIDYVEIEYKDAFIISFFPMIKHTSQTPIVIYLKDEICVEQYLLHIIDELKKVEKIILNILFFREHFLTEELTEEQLKLVIQF
jgi:hypothetical protein